MPNSKNSRNMVKNLRFTKFSGAGNDFVIVDNRQNLIRMPLDKLAIKVCQLKLGVGADGLVVVEKSRSADFKMLIFNSDGSEAEMCGNGARCVARFAHLHKIAGREMDFETKAGLISAEVKDAVVKLRMSQPHDFKCGLRLNLDGNLRSLFFINTGVPHTVMLVKNVDKVNVLEWGRKIRNHRLFKPAGTNVDFVGEIDHHNIVVRTYERGVENETLACGTGAVASALVAAGEKKVFSPVQVHTRGGEILKIYFDLNEGKFNEVYMEGEVRFVFTGTLKEL